MDKVFGRVVSAITAIILSMLGVTMLTSCESKGEKAANEVIVAMHAGARNMADYLFSVYSEELSGRDLNVFMKAVDEYKSGKRRKKVDTKQSETIRLESINAAKYHNYFKDRGLDFNGWYTEADYKLILAAIKNGGDRTITRGEFSELPDQLRDKLIRSNDIQMFRELRGVSNENPTRTTDTGTDTDKDKGYSWIVGIWRLDTPYGTSSIRFEGNGKKGRVVELSDATNAYSAEYGEYFVEGNKIKYIIKGEPVTTYIEIESGNRLHAGNGYYYRKIQ